MLLFAVCGFGLIWIKGNFWLALGLFYVLFAYAIQFGDIK